MSQPILSVESVSKSFGGFMAVSDMTLALAPGEIRALIGPNGAGKTTLLNVIGATYRPTAGSVRLHGKDIVGMPAHRIVKAGLSRSFQITSIFSGISVFENVQLALLAKRSRCHNLYLPARRQFADDVDRLLEQVRMGGFSRRRAGTLPAGDRKRLEFAIALAGEPEILLLDEPTAGMTSAERSLVIDVLLDINRDRGTTILFTEHDIGMVFSVAQQITAMKLGKLLAEGTPAYVREHPGVKEAYLGSNGHD